MRRATHRRAGHSSSPSHNWSRSFLGVLAIIWNQQQTTDNLRTELRADIIRLETELRAEFSNEIDGLRTEMGELRAEIGELRVQVVENGQRLARIEGFLGIGIPDSAPQGDARGW